MAIRKRSDEFASIRKRYDNAKERGTLTNGWKRKGAYSEQDVIEISKEIKDLWSKMITSASDTSLMHGKSSEDFLRLGLAINDIKTMAKDMATTLENQDRTETLVEEESREEIVKKRIRSVAARRIKNMSHTKTARKIAKDKIKLIKAYQQAGEEGLVHPLICGNDSSHDILNPMFMSGTNEVVLICWDCDYIQKHIPPAALDKRFLDKARKNKEFLK